MTDTPETETETDTLVVADDLTGAMDTGHAFAARGYETVVGLDYTNPPTGQVVVADTDSRYIPPQYAAKRVRTAIGAVDPARVYKKVDSTLRGNLAAEVGAALEASGTPLALVAPAFPANGRTTACGTHLVDGRPVTETDAAADPEQPVRTADLPSRFSVDGYPTTHLDIGVVANGPDAIREALPERGVVACDATHDAHLAAVADGGRDTDPLFVGSGGLAAHVPVAGQPAATDSPTRQSCDADAPLGVVGSIAPETLAQLDALPDEVVVELDATTAVVDPGEAATDAVNACVERRTERGAAHRRLVLTAATDATAVDDALAAATRHDVSESTARTRIADALALAARRLWIGGHADGLVLTGGTIAGAVLSEFEARGVQLTGEAIASGVPVGVVRDGLADGAPVVTKAGGFGERRTILKAFSWLSGDNAEH